VTWRSPDADAWVSRLGLVVIWRDLQELDELIVPPVIALRATTTAPERRWLIFHAIAHLRLHTGNQLYLVRSGDSVRLAKQEHQAEVWTARLLVPGCELMAAIADGLAGDELAEMFSVPAAGIALGIGLL
jgi:Zn-dependent peptidase ImmA (M78 family)